MMVAALTMLCAVIGLGGGLHILSWQPSPAEAQLRIQLASFIPRGESVRNQFREEYGRLLAGHTAADWWEAGALIRKIGDANNWDTGKRRDFQNAALIALTARRHGATVVTANAADFALLARELEIAVLPV